MNEITHVQEDVLSAKIFDRDSNEYCRRNTPHARSVFWAFLPHIWKAIATYDETRELYEVEQVQDLYYHWLRRGGPELPPPR